jgi:hypothetical protein
MSHAAPLTDLLVHQQDMRRPLGLGPDLDPQRLRVCLRYVSAAADRGGRRGPKLASAGIVGGLCWEAENLDWSWGEGPVVRAPAEVLLMVLSGRWVGLAELSGDGVATLLGRLPG